MGVAHDDAVAEHPEHEPAEHDPDGALKQHSKGAPIHDVRRKGGMGVKNGRNLRTNRVDFVENEGVGVKNKRIVWKPLKQIAKKNTYRVKHLLAD